MGRGADSDPGWGRGESAVLPGQPGPICTLSSPKANTRSGPRWPPGSVQRREAAPGGDGPASRAPRCRPRKWTWHRGATLKSPLGSSQEPGGLNLHIPLPLPPAATLHHSPGGLVTSQPLSGAVSPLKFRPSAPFPGTSLRPPTQTQGRDEHTAAPCPSSRQTQRPSAPSVSNQGQSAIGRGSKRPKGLGLQRGGRRRRAGQDSGWSSPWLVPLRLGSQNPHL